MAIENFDDLWHANEIQQIDLGTVMADLQHFVITGEKLGEDMTHSKATLERLRDFATEIRETSFEWPLRAHSELEDHVKEYVETVFPGISSDQGWFWNSLDWDSIVEEYIRDRMVTIDLVDANDVVKHFYADGG